MEGEEESPPQEAEEQSPTMDDLSTTAVEGMGLHDDVSEPMDDSISEQLIEEENQIMEDEEREKTLTVEDIGHEEDMGPPEMKEVIESEELNIASEDDTVVSVVNEELDVSEVNEMEEEGAGVIPLPEESQPKDDQEGDDKPKDLYEMLANPDVDELHAAAAEQTKSKPKKLSQTPKGRRKTYPYRARDVREDDIMKAIRVPAPKHDYFKLIFSAESKRPPSYYKNYFLPLQKQPRDQQHMKTFGVMIPKEAVRPYTTAPTKGMPLSTVKIRWRSHRNCTVYKADDLYSYLTGFGPVEAVYQLTTNSALVVFGDLETATSVMNAPLLGHPWDPLFPSWHNLRLNNRNYFKKYALIEEAPHKGKDIPIFQ